MKRSPAPQQPRPRRFSLLVLVVSASPVFFFLVVPFSVCVTHCICLFVCFLTVFKHLTKERKKAYLRLVLYTNSRFRDLEAQEGKGIGRACDGWGVLDGEGGMASLYVHT